MTRWPILAAGWALGLLLGASAHAGALQEQIDARLDQTVDLLGERDFDSVVGAVDALLGDATLSDQDLARALRYKGTAYLYDGLFGKALATLSSALEISPRDPWLLWRRCEVNTQIGLLASARRDCHDASRLLDSRWANTLETGLAEYLDYSISLTEAEVHRKLGAHDRAIKMLEGIEVSADLEAIDWRRSEALATLNFDIESFDEAIRHLDTAIDGSASAPAVNRAFLYFVRAASKARLDQPEASAADYAMATNLDPDSELYLFRACDFALDTEQRALAEDACTRLVDLYPDKDIYQRVASINDAQAGRVDQAVERASAIATVEEDDTGLFEAIEAAAEVAEACDPASCDADDP
ncbi:tetratricopeptide repeat protein [Palleronia pelagia]|uniref:Uncharacterized protein n=1 Tax=Palleronia pelagia TaxID=387096 RepID=A0A1H8AN30_9RHOB|nr:hypothetical protein [Palleronia pelagia]SEM72145.1 hypothetical protein SAMN04488011_101235 [Palleronia pelagia]